ncbi:hypothetical protein DFQ27_001724 [Actinomortierella ambigua]|uniref:Carotenoid oxygenase n=1 Tax=Actinomortierella ambigua TaxID=1343610 RepID=A0A9P6QJZ3_9FUNG|nr:hypothetical protein DFQ26_001456 [Actinomortierella ambigua]KAG0269880.1 hypothetical protein DFQ27_001724 [Actinomortierella ambigua]
MEEVSESDVFTIEETVKQEQADTVSKDTGNKSIDEETVPSDEKGSAKSSLEGPAALAPVDNDAATSVLAPTADTIGAEVDSHDTIEMADATISSVPAPVAASSYERPDHYTDNIITFHKALRNASSTEAPVELEVEGKLPEHLTGFHYSVTPGIFEVKYSKMVIIDGEPDHETRTFTFGHWFDNIPLIHQFALSGEDNKIKYRSTMPARRTEHKIRETQGFLPNQPSTIFQTDTNQSVFARFLSTASSNGRPGLEPCGASAEVLPPFSADGRRTIYCRNFANHILELDADTLTKRGILAWDEVNPKFKGTHSSPHSHYDPVTKELINFTMDHGFNHTEYHFFSITEKEPHGSLIATIHAKTSHVHSFAVTPRYIILVVAPWSPADGGVKYSWGASILEALAFKRGEPAHFYVISRIKRRHIATYTSEAFFFLHHVNAYEDEADNVYLDFAYYPDDTIAHQFGLSSLLNGTPVPLVQPELCRFELANVQIEAHRFEQYMAAISGISPVDKLRGFMRRVANSGAAYDNPEKISYAVPVATRVRSLAGVELPRINPIYRGLDYKFTWGVGLLEGGDRAMYDCIVKMGVKGDIEPIVWSEKNCFPSEAVFVPPATIDPEEDKGSLISVVYNAEANKSFLLVLNAKDLKEEARAWLPQVVPLSFSSGSFAYGDVSHIANVSTAQIDVEEEEDPDA